MKRQNAIPGTLRPAQLAIFLIAPVLCALVCLLASMNLMAAPSVSLEGRTLWLVQSLPVRPWQVLRAKLQLQLVLTAVPALIAAVCAAVAAARPVGETLLLLAVPLAVIIPTCFNRRESTWLGIAYLLLLVSMIAYNLFPVSL